MAQNKKSVLLYCDIIHTIEQLDDSDAGLLFKHYLRYINDQNPEPPSKLIQIVFEPIRQNLKRDLKKWEDKSLKNKDNANKRWNANASERIKHDANYADKDKVTVKVKDKVTVKVKDKVKYRDLVNLTLSEFDKLVSEYGEQPTNWMLDKLNAYKLSKGKTYKSDYGAILTWVVKSYEEHKKTQTKEETNPLINAINKMYKQS
jgi:hypothetical protein